MDACDVCCVNLDWPSFHRFGAWKSNQVEDEQKRPTWGLSQALTQTTGKRDKKRKRNRLNCDVCIDGWLVGWAFRNQNCWPTDLRLTESGPTEVCLAKASVTIGCQSKQSEPSLDIWLVSCGLLICRAGFLAPSPLSSSCDRHDQVNLISQSASPNDETGRRAVEKYQNSSRASQIWCVDFSDRC